MCGWREPRAATCSSIERALDGTMRKERGSLVPCKGGHVRQRRPGDLEITATGPRAKPLLKRDAISVRQRAGEHPCGRAAAARENLRLSLG